MTTINQRFTFFLAVLLLAVVPAAAQNVAFTKTGALTATNASCTATACVSMPVTSGSNAIGVQITGTFTGTVTFEGSVDGTNYVTTAVVPVGTTRTLTGTATAAGVWQWNVSGLTAIRARCTAFTSGTINVTINRSAGHPPAQ
jgi:hypothetical protein